MTDDTAQITVGEEVDSGESVSLPVIDVLAGRGFITGKSGSGKSNTASVVAEQLLEAGYGLLIVDVDGEYYGLKEEYELLHAGADEECDIQVSPEHAEKLATLALEENVPIILDASSYLDTEAADEMLLAVARQLFAKAKKQKKPFLVLVEECHEYIPEGGGMTETGKMLIKIGKRGRKHGLGIVGMSQRPADVKKDFITQCDWMVWHRLTWDNDTRVVGRILGSEYADRVEDLGDGEAFFDADWNEDVLRVQFDRKRTFDAGATPGLEEFERPELQSVSADLVADLEAVSEERERHESEIGALEAELQEKEQRIEELETELAEARDMSDMADKFAQALVENAESSPPENAPAEPEVAEAEEFVADAARGGYPGDEPVPEADTSATELLREDQRELHDYEREDGSAAEAPDVEDLDGPATVGSGDEEESTATPEEGGSGPPADGRAGDSTTQAVRETKSNTDGLQPVKTVPTGSDSADDEDAVEDADDVTEENLTDAAANGAAADDADLHASTDDEGVGGDDSSSTEDSDRASDRTRIQATGGWPQAGDTELEAEPDPDLIPAPETGAETSEELERRLSEEFGLTMEPGSDLTGGSLGSSTSDGSPAAAASASTAENGEREPAAEPTEPDRTGVSEDCTESNGSVASEESGENHEEPESSDGADDVAEAEPADQPEEGVFDPTADRGARLTEHVESPELRDEEAVVRAFVHGIEALDDVTRGMLEHYRCDDDSPTSAHVAGGGSGERQYAYARNRTLRKAGLVEHVGGGRYRYRLPELVTEAFDAPIDEERLADTVASIEGATGLAER